MTQARGPPLNAPVQAKCRKVSSSYLAYAHRPLPVHQLRAATKNLNGSLTGDCNSELIYRTLLR